MQRVFIKSTRCLISKGPETDPSATRLLYLIPGNPGIVEWYETFLALLGRLNPDTVFVVSAHAGHTPEEYAKQDADVDLHAQIQHKIDIFDQLELEYRASGITRFDVAGHSIGAYMALELTRARPIVGHCYCLFPTLHSMRESPQGSRLSVLFLPGTPPPTSLILVPGVRNIVAYFAGLIQLLYTIFPRPIVLLIRLLTGHTQELTQVSLQSSECTQIALARVMHVSVIYNTLSLASSEMEVVTSPNRVSLFLLTCANRCR